jgi:hypothetical protein
MRGLGLPSSRTYTQAGSRCAARAAVRSIMTQGAGSGGVCASGQPGRRDVQTAVCVAHAERGADDVT